MLLLSTKDTFEILNSQIKFVELYLQSLYGFAKFEDELVDYNLMFML